MAPDNPLPVPPRYAHILFCEDIRKESSGQVTVIGWFRSHLLNVQVLPPIAAQVAVAVQIVTPKTMPVRSLKIRVTWRDEVIHEFAPTEEEVARLQASKDPDPSTTRHALSVDVKIPNLHVDQEGKLHAFVIADDEILNHTALRFRFPVEDLADASRQS